MPKVEDYKKYFTELAEKAGLSEEQKSAVLEVWDNQTIREGFVPRSNYSADLDAVRDKTRSETQAATKEFYDKWFSTEAKPVYDKALAAVDKLAKYQQLYGDLEGTPPTQNHTSTITAEDVDKKVQEALGIRDTAYANMTKNAMRLAARHLKEFGEVLDPDDLEKFASNNNISDPNLAYQAYVAPRVEAKKEQEIQERIDKAVKEAKESMQDRSLAPNAQRKEYVNPFLHPATIPEGSSAEQEAQNAFFEGWNEGGS